MSRRSGRADFPHPAFGQGLLNSSSHTFAHEPLPLRSLKLVQSQLLVQVLVGEVIPSLPRHLELGAQPLTHPIACVAVDVPVGLAHRPDAEVVGPAPALGLIRPISSSTSRQVFRLSVSSPIAPHNRSIFF